MSGSQRDQDSPLRRDSAHRQITKGSVKLEEIKHSARSSNYSRSRLGSQDLNERFTLPAQDESRRRGDQNRYANALSRDDNDSSRFPPALKAKTSMLLSKPPSGSSKTLQTVTDLKPKQEASRESQPLHASTPVDKFEANDVSNLH